MMRIEMNMFFSFALVRLEMDIYAMLVHDLNLLSFSHIIFDANYCQTCFIIGERKYFYFISCIFIYYQSLRTYQQKKNK